MAAIHEVPGATFERVARTLTAAFHALKSYEYGNHSAVLAKQVTGEVATAHFMLTGVPLPNAPPERRPYAWVSPRPGGRGEIVTARAERLNEQERQRLIDDGWFPLYRDPA